ncbi:hypothetical protein DL96DRAFT_1558761 [Flagelloscypha sp. PMI_526]|nr:hypothetical protein DL96DRAFT_1558761 [Flagelloscypha sp. PMI_526]
MHPVPVPVRSPLKLILPQMLSILICSIAYCFAVLDATTIRCCDGLPNEPGLLAIAAITLVYHAVIMLVDNYLRLWAPTPPREKQGIQPATVYSHRACALITFFASVSWFIFLIVHATGYINQSSVSGQHYYIPMLALEGLEILVLGWLLRQSVVEQPKE